jgi:hypothetical protein
LEELIDPNFLVVGFFGSTFLEKRKTNREHRMVTIQMCVVRGDGQIRIVFF